MLVSSGAYAENAYDKNHVFYFGGIFGFGATTWHQLIPTQENQNDAMAMSTPILVEEGGGTWGLMLGFEFHPQFAIELNYLNYPASHIYFDEFSIFSFEHDGTTLHSETESVNLMGKFMIPFYHDRFKVFSSLGAAILYRHDPVMDDSRLTPCFGAGINYRVNTQFLLEIAGNYTAGFGQSQLSPANGYFPFLYSITGRLAYFL